MKDCITNLVTVVFFAACSLLLTGHCKVYDKEYDQAVHPQLANFFKREEIHSRKFTSTVPPSVGVNKISSLPFSNHIDLRREQVTVLKNGTFSNKVNSTNEQLISLLPDRNIINWLYETFGFKPPLQVTDTPEEKCPPCRCGISYKMTRIVGGTETQVNMYPWVAALMYNSRFYCGASVINDKFLITAAHCITGFNKDRISATFLVHDRTLNETQAFSRNIKDVIRHRSYHSGVPYNNDIALLEVDTLEFNEKFKPVCLPMSEKSYTGESGIVIGWGATEENGQISSKLREVEVPILSNEECRKTGYGKRITDNMLCAGYPTGMKDACQGDSGGPLHVRNGALYEIAGIVSWGEGCAQPNYPGVYTRVNKYISWIKTNTKNACYCS